MGKRGPQPKAKAVAPPAPLKAKGKGQQKRTPTSAFDPAAKDDDVYQCERIVGKRLAKGITVYCVKWAGYDTKDNTWEPLENLAGCESFISDFNQREQTRIAQAEAVAEQKHREKQEAAEKRAAEQAEAAAAALREEVYLVLTCHIRIWSLHDSKPTGVCAGRSARWPPR